MANKGYVITDGSKYLLPSGYIDMGAVITDGNDKYIFVIGGRGCGKTYGAIKYVVETGQQLFFMRRTQTQLDAINVPYLSPFGPYNTDYGTNIELKRVHKQISILTNDDDEVFGFAGALSTMANLRGINASDLGLMIYDEFIPEPHQPKIKEEASALKNVYETINRNRELDGQPPVKCVCISNSDTVAAPIFIDWHLVKGIMDAKSLDGDVQVIRWSRRGIKVVLVNDTPVLRAKRQTALYEADGDSKYSDMALKNQFVYDDFSCVQSEPLTQYTPLVVIGSVCIYKHKSKRQYYCTRHKSGSPAEYQDTELGRKAFGLRYHHLYLAMIDQRVYFEDYEIKVYLTESVFNVKLR